MTNPNIIQLRGTIFLPVIIGYSQVNVDKYRVILEESVVAPIPPLPFSINVPPPPNIQISQEQILQDNGPWQLIKGPLRVLFLPNKIDIILESVNTKGLTETTFCQRCSDIFSKIVELSSVNATRLAFSPVYAKDPDETFNSQEFWSTMLVKSSYDDVFVEGASITGNYRVSKKINDKNIVVNFRSVVSDAIRNVAPGVAIKGCVMISFDINTAVIVDKQNSFTKSDIYDFFINVYRWSDDFFVSVIS